MENITAEKLKELAKYLDRHYNDTEHSIDCVLDDIREWLEEEALEVNPIKVDAVLCENQEITHGYNEIVAVDSLEEKDYLTVYYIWGITADDGEIIISVSPVRRAFEEDY